MQYYSIKLINIIIILLWYNIFYFADITLILRKLSINQFMKKYF